MSRKTVYLNPNLLQLCIIENTNIKTLDIQFPPLLAVVTTGHMTTDNLFSFYWSKCLALKTIDYFSDVKTFFSNKRYILSPWILTTTQFNFCKHWLSSNPLSCLEDSSPNQKSNWGLESFSLSSVTGLVSQERSAKGICSDHWLSPK